MINFSDSRNRK